MTPERRNVWQGIKERIRAFPKQGQTDPEMRDREEKKRAREEHIGSLLAEYPLDEMIRGQAAGVIPTPQRVRSPLAIMVVGVFDSIRLATKVNGIDYALTQRQLEMTRHYGEEEATRLHLEGLALQRIYWERALQGNPSEPLQRFGQSRLEAIRGQTAELNQPQFPQSHS